MNVNEHDELAKDFVDEQPPRSVPQKVTSTGGFTFKFDKAIDLTRLWFLTNSTTNPDNPTRRQRILDVATSKDYFDFELIPGDKDFYL